GNADDLAGMGEANLAMGRYAQARQFCEQALQINPQMARAHFILGNIYREQSAFDAAERHYAQVVQIDPGNALAYYYRGNMLKTQGQTEMARASYDNALSCEPGLVEAEWNRQRLLPIIFSNEEEIGEAREAYSRGLEKLEQGLNLDTAAGRRQALKGLYTSTNFYLQYQGCDDLELQCKYGNIISSVMSCNYPQWSRSMAKKELPTGTRIRVGYASAFLRAHNGAVWLLGWLRHRNRERFEIFCYHTGGKIDDKTAEFKELCDHFYHIPNDLERVCGQIVKNDLHILVYPELGMDAQSMLMAGLRLAPVQCVGWGHPITSGLKTMDYWLSSDLMEPDDGQEHYLEKLVRLPNMANCYSKAQHDQLQASTPKKTRKDFGLPDDSVLYFCSQSLFKYLPQYDYLWPEIALRVPKAKFVFLAISSIHVVKLFMARVEKTFKKYGLDAKDYCIMMNRQTPEDYMTLNQLVDVFLDNPPWSGNNTGLAAIDAHLPIVCYPTQFMRGRHSYAILKMLGVTETIAQNEQEYIDIAVKLGTDREWRKSIVDKIAHQHENIYEDVECVRGLESFYEKVVRASDKEFD
ncbi:MAG TPA: tetratricopeptide repeat protein, partial [Gammaproteobacteria bacterium]|nr:tetratricopeptide repeat protein [Gammaproteobacteria bacterium]